MGHKVTMVILSLGVISMRLSNAEPHGGGNKWARSSIMPQDYHSLLLGIDQRMRNLETIRHVVSRTDISLQSLSNRIDLIDSRLQTVQNSFQNTFEVMTATVKSSEIKYELLFEQLTRKLDVGIERLTHKLNNIESRNEATMNKIQNQLDMNFGRIDNKQTSIGNEVLRLNSDIDFIRSQTIDTEERNNQTFKILINHLQDIRMQQQIKKEHLKNITDLVTEMHSNRSDGGTVLSDAPHFSAERLHIIKSEINDEGHKIGAKLSNMYNDLWKTVKDLEMIIRGGFEESDKTSREAYSKLSNLLLEEKGNSESFIDIVLRSSLASVGNHLRDLQRQIDNKFKEFRTSQETHGESCHKIKGLIENNVAIILEKMYDTFINRTSRFSKQINDVGELMKDHNKQLIQSTAEVNSFLVTLAEESSQEHKQIDSLISDVADNFQDFQIGDQEVNDKQEASFKEIKSLLLMNNNQRLNITNSQHTNYLNAIEANYSNGVINIKTDPTHQLPKEKDNSLGDDKTIEIPLETLNKTISITDFAAVIGESRKKNIDTDEDTKRKDKKREEKEDIEVHEQTVTGEGKPVDSTQVLLAYIKLLHGHLTPHEFLIEAVPGNSYKSFDDMIKHLQNSNNMPREIIYEIQQLAQEQNYKESIQTDRETERIIKKLQENKNIDDDENYDEDHDDDDDELKY